MKKLIALSFTFIISLANSAFAENYIWPLKLTPELTSKFCDYRAGHFHSGLDLRTGGKIGVPVYAIDNGYVYRVATSFRGYGKALYLKLNDGRIVVYGHLSSFSESVNAAVRAAQLKDKKYTQDLFFTSSDFPVKKGERVALSGSTGTGAPHLHFEMRSSQNNPINPLLCGYKLPDISPSVFDYLSIRYYKNGLELGESCQSEFIRAVKQGRNYVISDTILSSDYLALGVSGGDHIGGPGFLYGFFGLRLSVDDSLLYEMDSDSLSYNTTRQLNYVRDLEDIRLFSTKKKTDVDANIFYRLYVPPGAEQYFWGKLTSKAGAIYPSSKPGAIRKIRVTAYDEYDNFSELRCYVREPDLPEPGIESYTRRSDTLIVNFQTTLKISSARVEYRNSRSEPFRNARNFLTSRIAEGDNSTIYENSLRIILPKGEREYRFCYLNDKKQISPWSYSRESGALEKIEISGSPEYLKITFSPKMSYDKLNLVMHDNFKSIELPLVPAGPKLYSASILNKDFSGSTRLTIFSAGSTIIDTTLDLNPVYPSKATEIYSPDSTLITSFQEGSAYYPAYIFSSSGIRSSLSDGPGVVFDLQPDIFLVDAPIRFKFNTSKLNLVGRKVGVYGYSYGSGGWNFIGKIDGIRLEANGFGLGKLALIEDNDPPIISSVMPAGRTRSAMPLLSAGIYDKISGLALDSGINMILDGMWVPAEYDIDSGRFSYKVRNSLKAGAHTLEIKAIDNQGNFSNKSITFTVSGK
jgi:hypothetical protein